MTYPSATTIPDSRLYPGSVTDTGVPEVDFDSVFNEIAERLQREKEERLAPPMVRLWDGDWNLRGIVRQEIAAKFQVIDNETGTGSLELPLDYFMSRWICDVDERGTTNIFVTVDKDGARWSGAMEEVQLDKQEDGKKVVRVLFKHDYEHAKHILCWVRRPLKALLDSVIRWATGLVV